MFRLRLNTLRPVQQFLRFQELATSIASHVGKRLMVKTRGREDIGVAIGAIFLVIHGFC